MKLVGIAGRRRVGKDVVAEYIHRTYGYTHRKFAQHLKDAVKCLFGFSQGQVESHLKDDVDPRWDVSPRQVLQFIGTEVLQYKLQELIPNVGLLFNVKRMFLDIKESDSVVISDVRFPHEVDSIKERGGVVIGIERATILDDTDTHSSESGIDALECDYVIQNNGALVELYAEIDRVMLQQ